MKNICIKATCLMLSVLMLIPLSSCSLFKKNDYVISVSDDSGKTVNGFSKGMFSFFLSQKKSYYLDLLKYSDSTITDDSPEIWKKPLPKDTNSGKTVGEVVLEEAIESAKYAVASTYLLEQKYNYKYPEKYTLYIDNQIDTYAKTFGTIEDFKAYLANYGTTYEDYRRLWIMTLNADLLLDLLYNSEYGKIKIPDEDKKQYFSDNYLSVKELYFNTLYITKLDGTKSPLTDEQKKEKTLLADKVMNRINAGEDFDALLTEYTGNELVTAFPNDTFVKKGDTASSTSKAVEGMEMGQIIRTEDNYGIHIIKRVPLDAEKYNADKDVYTALNTDLAENYFLKNIKPYVDKITVNTKLMESFDVSTAMLVKSNTPNTASDANTAEASPAENTATKSKED